MPLEWNMLFSVPFRHAVFCPRHIRSTVTWILWRVGKVKQLQKGVLHPFPFLGIMLLQGLSPADIFCLRYSLHVNISNPVIRQHRKTNNICVANVPFLRMKLHFKKDFLFLSEKKSCATYFYSFKKSLTIMSGHVF